MDKAFYISPTASARIAYLLASEPAGSRLRVSVLGGGCSGFQYKFDFDAAALAEDDALFGEGNVVVDATSLDLLAEATLDYTEELGGAAFAIKNPQAKSGCGCGNSFALG